MDRMKFRIKLILKMVLGYTSRRYIFRTVTCCSGFIWTLFTSAYTQFMLPVSTASYSVSKREYKNYFWSVIVGIKVEFIHFYNDVDYFKK